MPAVYTPRTWSFHLVALLVACVLVVAGCGGSDDEGGSTGGASGETAGGDANAVEANSADTQKLLTEAFRVEVDPATVPQPIVAALTRSLKPLDQAQKDKAFECFKASKCTVGTGKTTLGIADGFGDNTWRKFSKMEAILQALTYPEIGKIIYTNAHGDLAQMQSNIRSLTAQGAKAMITYDDMGSAVGPAFAAHQRAGGFVSNFVGPVPDVDAKTIAVQAIPDGCQNGKAMIDATAKLLSNKGNIAYFNGVPGNPQGKTWNKCADDQIKAKYPDLKVTVRSDTQWTPAGAGKAASSLISSGKDVDAILYDYADPVVQIVDAYDKANQKPPAIVTWTENNGAYGQWVEKQGTENEYPLVSTMGLNWVARVSVSAVMDKLAGKDVPNQLVYPQPFVEAKETDYQADLPSDFPGASTLIPDDLIERMLGA